MSNLIKRCFDVTAALVMLIITSPLILAITIVVRRDGGSALFLQERVGLRGKKFKIIKFRSMIVGAEEMIQNDPFLHESYLANYKTEDDSLVTSLGRVLRATYMDELPQLINVLRGDMSLVGPRPVVEEEIAEFGDLAETILTVRPGMTGYWQINKQMASTYYERACMEARYAKNWSPAMDLLILAHTAIYVTQLLVSETFKRHNCKVQ